MSLDNSVYDFTLTIDGTEYGFFVAEDQNGIEQWGDGLAPFITPQFRTDPYGYDHTPPEIEVPIVAEDWTSAGFEHIPSGQDTQVHVYNYSRGMDLSNRDRIFASPQRQSMLESDGTAIGGQPTKFLQTSLGFMMLAGQYIYEWDTSSQSWVQKDDATADAVNYKDMVELDAVIYASRGSTADYKYSADGTTYTAFTDADENADFFSVRGNSSDIASVWKVLSNLIKGTPDGKNGGTSWSGADEVGNTSETVTGMVTVDNDIYIFKKQGIYIYDGTNTQDLWKTTYAGTYDGKNPYTWVNGHIYVPYAGSLIEFDPRATDSLTLRPVFPMEGMDSHELLGDITAVAGDTRNIYLAVRNFSGNTYILKGKPDVGWHTLAYLGANDCLTMEAVAPGVVHDTNPVLVFGYGSTASAYFILPRGGFHPGNDPECKFDTATSTLYGPWVNFGAKTYNKFLNRASVLGDDLSASSTFTLKYEVDRDGTETTIVTASSNGTTESETSSEVQFNQLRYVCSAVVDSSYTFGIDSIAFFATLNPPRKRVWNPIVNLSDTLYARGGLTTITQPAASNMREILYNAATKRITLTDNDGHDHTVRLLGIESTGRAKKQSGGKEHFGYGYRLALVEINSTTGGQVVAVYDSSTYDSGHVYS